MVVLRWSVGKRVIGWMPERPAVSAAQLSSTPCPSDVTTPMPVMATIGRPRWSVVLVIGRLLSRDDEGSALETMMSNGGGKRSLRRAVKFRLVLSVECRIRRAVLYRERGKGDREGELRFAQMSGRSEERRVGKECRVRWR